MIAERDQPNLLVRSLALVTALDTAVKKTISRYDPQFHDLSPLQEPSPFEDRRHRLLDPRGPRPRLLRAGEVKQVSSLRTRRQRLERALESRIVAELLLQFLGYGKLWGLRLNLHSGLLGRHGLAHVRLDGGRLRRNLLGAGELHHPRCLNLPELHQQLLRVLQQRALKEAQRAIFFEALNDDNVFSIHCVAGLPPLALLS